jgi:hypothetical protein
MVAVLLAAHLVSVTPFAMTNCEPLRSPLRVRLTIVSGEWRRAEPTIRRLVEDTWQPAGLRVEWVTDEEARWNAIEFWIAVVNASTSSAEGEALGFVRFKGERPNPMARISIDAALLWARRHRARSLPTPSGVSRGRRYDPDLVHRIMGYAAAHELGHFVLATRTHARSGVMQVSYRQPKTMLDAKTGQLDGRSAAVLKQRLSNCTGQ